MRDRRATEATPTARKLRQFTSSHLLPYDERHYVVALPSFFKKHVCFWMGCVRDDLTGVYDTGGTRHVLIKADGRVGPVS